MQSMDFDLTRLGAREFEHLSQALAIRVLGHGVKVFGDGPDGGREATFNGLVEYPDPSPNGRWNGVGIIQAKYKERLGNTNTDNTWFANQVLKELKSWKNSDSKRRKQGRLPDYILFTTNVWLSSVPGTGGIDKVYRLLEEHAGDLGLKGWDFWGGDQICRYLENATDVRRSFAGFITPGDVLSQVLEVFPKDLTDVTEALSSHTAKELIAAQWVRLNQAGSPDNEKLKLADIGIDLPAVDSSRQEVDQLVGHIISLGDSVMRPSNRTQGSRHVVIIGGPGQGKTTLTQLLCQTYRAELLSGRPEHKLSTAAPALAAMQDRLRQLSMAQPGARRWPISINLSDYGEAIAGGEDIGLLRFIAQQISKRLSIDVTPSQLKAWLSTWPWLLVLDGLDEVAAPSIRENVEQNVNEFLVDAADADADLLVVATTRPQGYNEEFSSNYFEHFRLRELDPEEAIKYATQVVGNLHSNDPDFAHQVVAGLEEAAKEPTTARLMQSPLQVTIMSLLLERRVRVPDNRYNLFESYYETIYSREVAKRGFTGALLEDHRNNINALHQQVALLLHARAETTGDLEPVLTDLELERVAVNRLTKEGLSNASELARKLVNAATNRLVLLAPIVQDHVGFDVRSLQEFMAARAVISGPDEEVVTRMDRLASSSHWRNTWLLAAGGIITHREHLRERLVASLDTLDTSSPLTISVAPGTLLAVDLLEEGIAARVPKYERIIVKHALGILDHPPGRYTERIAAVLPQIVQRDPGSNSLIKQAIDRAAHSTGWPLLSAILVLAEWADQQNQDATSSRMRLDNALARLDANQRDAVADISTFFPHRSLHGGKNQGRRESLTLDNIITMLKHRLSEEVDDRDRAGIRADLLQRFNEREATEGVKEYSLVAPATALRAMFRIGHAADERWRVLGSWSDLMAVAEEFARISEEAPLQEWDGAYTLRQLAAQWYGQSPVADAVAKILPLL